MGRIETSEPEEAFVFVTIPSEEENEDGYVLTTGSPQKNTDRTEQTLILKGENHTAGIPSSEKLKYSRSLALVEHDGNLTQKQKTLGLRVVFTSICTFLVILQIISEYRASQSSAFARFDTLSEIEQDAFPSAEDYGIAVVSTGVQAGIFPEVPISDNAGIHTPTTEPVLTLNANKGYIPSRSVIPTHTDGRSLSMVLASHPTRSSMPAAQMLQIPSSAHAYYENFDKSFYSDTIIERPIAIPMVSQIPFVAPKVSPLFINVPESPTTSTRHRGSILDDTNQVLYETSCNLTEKSQELYEVHKASLFEQRRRDGCSGNEGVRASLHTCISLTQYTFHEYMREHESVFVTFYFPCRAYSAKFAPLWNNFTSALLDTHLPVEAAVVNCHSHPNICREQEISRSPVSRFYHLGQVVLPDFRSKRTVKKLLRYTKRALHDLRFAADDDTGQSYE